MNIIAIIPLAAVLLTGCATDLPNSLRIIEHEGMAASTILLPGSGGQERGCLVSTTDNLLPGLAVYYRGDRCGVEYCPDCVAEVAP
jgi:hypothetical protein